VELKEPPVLQEQWDLKDYLEFKVLMALKVLLVCKDPSGLKGLKDLRDHVSEFLVRQVLPALVVLKDVQD